MPLVTLDTESYLMVPGLQSPPLVCIQWLNSNQDGPGLALVRDMEVSVCAWLDEPIYRLHGHNVAFDMACIGAQWPDMLDLVFKAYEEDRITCTMIRARLIDIAQGIPLKGRKYNLEACAQRAKLAIIPNKADEWRLKYGTLANTPVDQWPEAARKYALEDVLVTRALYDYQEQYKHFLEDQYRQARAAFMLQLTRCWGLKTDLEYVKAYHRQCLDKFEADRAIAMEAGLVRHDGSKDTKAAAARMVQVMEALGEAPALTKGGGVQLDEDACEASGDGVLKAYQRYGSIRTMMSRLDRLYWGSEVPLQPRFEVLMETGRTSCSQGDWDEGESPSSIGFQSQNLPRSG